MGLKLGTQKGNSDIHIKLGNLWTHQLRKTAYSMKREDLESWKTRVGSTFGIKEQEKWFVDWHN